MSLDLIINRLMRKVICLIKNHSYTNFRKLEDPKKESDFEKYCTRCAKLNINIRVGYYSDVGRVRYYMEMLHKREREAFERVYGKVA